MLKEIVALAMAGYKKKDIDAILDLENKEAQKPPQETHKDEEKLQEPKDDKKDPAEASKDFEALYNETLKALGETQEKLALATRENADKPVGTAGGKSQEDVLDELTKLLNR